MATLREPKPPMGRVGLEQVWDQIADPLLLTGPDDRIQACNRAALAVLGLDSAKVIGSPLAAVAGLQGGGVRRTPLEAGGQLVSLASTHEVLDQLDLYRRALNSHPECTLVVDPEARILLINHAYEEILGIRAEDVLGVPVAEVIENTRLHVVAKTGVPEVGQIQRIRGKDAVVQRVPLVRDGKIIGVLGKVMFRDVSEVKQLHDRLQMLYAKVEYYESEIRQIRSLHASLGKVIGVSDKLKAVRELSDRAARTNADVLILGESGVGKELFAQAIHQTSERSAGPLIKVNCAALPSELLESELFGYDAGAFTGAKKGGKPGKFELADGGTIFLDEVGDMSLAMQAKVLRVLQEREFERVGGLNPVKVDVRVIAATNRDLEQMIKDGKFRLDLFYRLNVICLTIPPLRERPEDIPVLLEHYLDSFAVEHHQRRRTFSPAAMAVLVRYQWPGNVRELRNLVERLIHLVDGPEITPDDLPSHINRAMNRTHRLPTSGTLPEVLAQTEKALIQEALERVKGNRLRAAELLGITRSTLYEKMAKHRLG